jgi:hypothetical protein
MLSRATLAAHIESLRRDVPAGPANRAVSDFHTVRSAARRFQARDGRPAFCA